MKKLFCPYCGNKLNSNGRCDDNCENIIAREEEETYSDWLDNYYTENAYGFAQQDLIDLRRFER